MCKWKTKKEKVRRLRSTNELFFGGGGGGWLSKGKHLFNITSLQMYSCFYSSLYEWRRAKKKGKRVTCLVMLQKIASLAPE